MRNFFKLQRGKLPTPYELKIQNLKGRIYIEEIRKACESGDSNRLYELGEGINAPCMQSLYLQCPTEPHLHNPSEPERKE